MPMARNTAGSAISRRLLLKSAGAAALAALDRSSEVRGQTEATVGVVGAGVVGLNVARFFAAQGLSVTVYAAKVSPGTTSDVAPAVLFPHLIEAIPAMQEAARRTNAFYESFLDAGVGVSRRTALILDNSSVLDPDIAAWTSVYGISQLPASEVPFGFAYGWSFQTMFVDTRVFMPFLVRMVLDGGTSITLRNIQTRDDLLALPHSIIANCTGLGARELVGDNTVYPVKGQLVTVTALPVTDLVVHGSDYVFARDDSAILGGTNEPHIEDIDPSETVTQGIIDRNQSVVPSLTRSQVTNVRAGLRPFREDGPRIEAEPAGEKLLLHNYGHGGGGWSLAPGCAELLYGMLP